MAVRPDQVRVDRNDLAEALNIIKTLAVPGAGVYRQYITGSPTAHCPTEGSGLSSGQRPRSSIDSVACLELGVLGGQAPGLLDRVLAAVLFHLIDRRLFQINSQTPGHHQGIDQNIG